MTMPRTRAWVVAITMVVDDIGTEQTFLVGSDGFRTLPTDTPPDTVVHGDLFDAGFYRSDLFSGARTTGLVRPALGQVVINNEGGTYDAWADFGISGGLVEAYDGYLGDPFPSGWTKAYRAYAAGLQASVPDARENGKGGAAAVVDVDRIAISLQSRETLLDTPVATEIYTPADTYVAGTLTKKKPVVFGEPGFVPLVLLDPVLLIYQVHVTAADARFLFGTGAPLYVPHDGGVPLTYAGYYPTAADGLDPAQAPAPGHYKVYGVNGTNQPVGTYPNSVGPCFVRLGSRPVFDLRIKPLGLYLANQSEPIRYWTFPDLCQRAGLTDVTPSALAAGSYVKQVGNRYIDGDETYLDLMNDVAATTFTVFGFNRLDQFYTFDLTDPDADPSEPVAYVFTQDNTRNFKRSPVPGQEQPVHQINGSSGKTWPGTVGGAATPEMQEEFTRQPWQDQWTVSSPSVRRANPGAISVDVKFDGREFAGGDAVKLAHGAQYIKLFGGRRSIFTFECSVFEAETLALDLGTKVQIKRNRFGCDAGRNFRIVSRSVNLKARTLTFSVWGGQAGPSDAVLGGEDGLARPVDLRTRDIGPMELTCLIDVGQPAAPAIVKDIGEMELTCLIEIPPPVVVDDWTPGGDPHWDKVIFLSYFERPDGLSASGSYDESEYHRSVGATALAVKAAGAIQGSSSLDFDGNNPLQSAAYNGSTEGIIGTQDWTLDVVVNPDASQTGTTPILLQVAPQFGPNWQAGNAVLHLDHVAPYDLAVSFWVYNFSSTVPLLYGTTDLSGGGVAHVGVSRDGNDWYLGIKGAIEDTATWSGSVNSAALYRYIGGTTIVGGSFVRGLVDCVRETVGVGRYTGPYSPPWGGPGGGGTAANFNLLYELLFEGADGATSTADTSVYAHTVTLAGGAVLATAQQQAGASSLYLPTAGARCVISGLHPLLNRTGVVDIEFYWRPASTADCVLWTKRITSAVYSPLEISVGGGKFILTAAANPLIPVGDIATFGPTVTAGTWYRIQVVNLGITLQLRINGVGVASVTLAAGVYNNNAPITMGSDFDGSQGATGYLDTASAVITP